MALDKQATTLFRAINESRRLTRLLQRLAAGNRLLHPVPDDSFDELGFDSQQGNYSAWYLGRDAFRKPGDFATSLLAMVKSRRLAQLKAALTTAE